jgi:GntR family transcriptional regulator/MocR family aminotransferase
LDGFVMVQPGLDLLLRIPPVGSRRAGVAQALRDAIRNGTLSAGTRLPSSRGLAADLGLSRGTVVDAYSQLAAEGWITTRPASGTIVADVPLARQDRGERGSPAVGAPRPRHDLRPGRPEHGSFPRRAWTAALRVVLTRAPDEIWDYGDPLGHEELRRELAAYLGRVVEHLTSQPTGDPHTPGTPAAANPA